MQRGNDYACNSKLYIFSFLAGRKLTGIVDLQAHTVMNLDRKFLNFNWRYLTSYCVPFTKF